MVRLFKRENTTYLFARFTSSKKGTVIAPAFWGVVLSFYITPLSEKIFSLTFTCNFNIHLIDRGKFSVPVKKFTVKKLFKPVADNAFL